MGIVVAAVGATVMWVAAGRKDHAAGVGGLMTAMGAGANANSAAVDSAVTLGYVGFGVLILGAVLALGGLYLVAAR